MLAHSTGRKSQFHQLCLSTPNNKQLFRVCHPFTSHCSQHKWKISELFSEHPSTDCIYIEKQQRDTVKAFITEKKVNAGTFTVEEFSLLATFISEEMWWATQTGLSGKIQAWDVKSDFWGSGNGDICSIPQGLPKYHQCTSRRKTALITQRSVTFGIKVCIWNNFQHTNLFDYQLCIFGG